MAKPRAGQGGPRRTDRYGTAHRLGELKRDGVESFDRLERIDRAIGCVFAEGHFDLTASGFPPMALLAGPGNVTVPDGRLPQRHRERCGLRELDRVSAVGNQLRGRRRSRAGGRAFAKGAPSVARFYIQPETSVSAIVLPSGSLTQAALKRPASKKPRSSVLIPGWSYCSKSTPRDASSPIVWSRSSTNQPASVAGDLPALSGER